MPPDKRIGPAGERGTDSDETSTAIKTRPESTPPDRPSPSPSSTQIAARRSWSYRLVSRCATPPPIFGSREWLELPEGTPAKVGAVVVAAECWAQGQDNLVDDLRRELDDRRAAHKAVEDAEYVARAEAHRTEWSRRTPSEKSFAERRAEQLASVEPCTGDFGGRGSA